MNKATMLEELVYSKRDIDGLKSAMVTAVAKREEEIARLRKMYEREREIAEQAQRDAEQWKTAPETQKESNLAILKEVERLKSENDWMKTSLSEVKSLMHLSYFIQAQIIVEQAIQRIQEGNCHGNS